MKPLYAVFLLAAAACTPRTDDGCTPADIRAAAAAGERDAAAAAAVAEATYGRDSAVMDIRARETRIREAGFGSAADAYAGAAARVLAENGIIDSICPSNTPK